MTIQLVKLADLRLGAVQEITRTLTAMTRDEVAKTTTITWSDGEVSTYGDDQDATFMIEVPEGS